MMFNFVDLLIIPVIPDLIWFSVGIWFKWLFSDTVAIQVKGAQSNCFGFCFQTFWDFGIRRKLVFSGEYYSWKMYHLEDINENVTSYGNNN